MNVVTFTVGLGISAPIEPGQYSVRQFTIVVSFPEYAPHLPQLRLPALMISVFVVSWVDPDAAAQLRMQTYERHLPRHTALGAISELLIAFKLARIGHADGQRVRTVGIADTLFYYSQVDGQSSGDLNVTHRSDREVPWASGSAEDPAITTVLAQPHIGTDTVPLSRKYLRCYELLDHGFFSEALIVAFSTLDDFVQETLHTQLETAGMASKEERRELLRGIKENRLKLYLGPLLKLVTGQDLYSLWTDASKAVEWLNKTRNHIAHAGAAATYAESARAIFVCLKIIVVLRQHGLTTAEITVGLFRHAKITAAWTKDPPSWVPAGEVAESMDFR